MKKHPHHGGAWKVAYADFVTAMMALFLVLWLTAQDSRIKEAVERAFRNPFSSATKESMGIIPNKDVQATHPEKGSLDSATSVQIELLRRMTEDLAKMLQQDEETRNDVKIEMTSEGVRINVYDRSTKPVFEGNTIEFTKYGDWVFSTLAWEIARYPAFNIELEGHTESGASARAEPYGGWELSSDRANAARRKLLLHGVLDAQIRKVAGLSDTDPMPQSEPTSEINRRVTVILKVKEGNRLSEPTAASKAAL